MSKPTFKPSNQIQRAFLLIETLAGHEFEPLKNSEVAKMMGVHAVDATRLLQNARHYGWVEQTPDGRWRLVRGKFTCIATSVSTGIQRSKSRFDDESNNYTRSAY